jgi:hypothetical protein
MANDLLHHYDVKEGNGAVNRISGWVNYNYDFNSSVIRTQISGQEFSNALDGVGLTQIIHCSINCQTVLTHLQSIHLNCDSVL